MADSVFEPTEHLIKVKGGQLYLEVKWRLIWLRQEHPNASVEAHLTHVDLERKIAIAQATVTLPDGTKATDIGSETEKDFPDGWVEKSATKAVGRALAALGFGTLFALELDEGNIAESPVAPTPKVADKRPAAKPAAGAPRPELVKRPNGKVADTLTGEVVDEEALSRLVLQLLQADAAAHNLLKAQKKHNVPAMTVEQLVKARDWVVGRLQAEIAECPDNDCANALAARLGKIGDREWREPLLTALDARFELGVTATP